jgi:hypothetical protein
LFLPTARKTAVMQSHTLAYRWLVKGFISLQKHDDDVEAIDSTRVKSGSLDFRSGHKAVYRLLIMFSHSGILVSTPMKPALAWARRNSAVTNEGKVGGVMTQFIAAVQLSKC